jgi:hypothetical protein
MGDTDLPIVAWPPLPLLLFKSSIKKANIKKKKKNLTMSKTGFPVPNTVQKVHFVYLFSAFCVIWK